MANPSGHYMEQVKNLYSFLSFSHKQYFALHSWIMERCPTGFINFVLKQSRRQHPTALAEQKAPLHSVTSQSRQGVCFHYRARFVLFPGKRDTRKVSCSPPFFHLMPVLLMGISILT